jgi:CheY-like chemotaxis protein
MDMRMPVMDGYEASRQIKMLDPGIRIIATTAYAMSGEKEKCMEAGCDSYISKPITIKTLIRIIGRHLIMNKDLQFNAVSLF